VARQVWHQIPRKTGHVPEPGIRPAEFRTVHALARVSREFGFCGHRDANRPRHPAAPRAETERRAVGAGKRRLTGMVHAARGGFACAADFGIFACRARGSVAPVAQGIERRFPNSKWGFSGFVGKRRKTSGSVERSALFSDARKHPEIPSKCAVRVSVTPAPERATVVGAFR
jgi:hypothetical protein